MDGDGLEDIPACVSDGKRRGSVNVSNLLITGLTPDIFLQIDPKSFAEQIYLFHFKKQKQFRDELVNPISYLPRPQVSVQMLNSLLFTTIAPHFLTKIIRNQILIDSQQEKEDPLLTRSKLLEHWIQVGLNLIELGDMTGWCAVAMGVCSVGVIRLRETWKAVRRDLVSHVQTNWVPALIEHGLFTQEMWAEEWINDSQRLAEFSRVLSVNNLHFKTHVLEPATPTTPSFPPPTPIETTENLPFFGTIRHFADRYRKYAKKYITPDMINFDEFRCLYDAITDSLSSWKHQKNDGFETAPIDTVVPLQSFFEHSVIEITSLPHDYKYLQECSLACEPRVFGQTFERHSKSGVDASCLVFPAILDSCSIFSSTDVPKSSQLKKQGHKGNRRRTYSFPPGSGSHLTVSPDLQEAANSHTWLSGQRTFSNKSLIEMLKKNSDSDDIVLSVQQGELIFKVPNNNQWKLGNKKTDNF